MLNKGTLRCSDYRKAMIILYLKLREPQLKTDEAVVLLLETAVSISHLLYTEDANRTPKSILALHNDTFQHCLLCKQLFPEPKNITHLKMFGRYFHSIIVHTPLLFRTISMRSLNTENQERMFGQAKSITKTTSSNRPNEVIINILARVEMEELHHEHHSYAHEESRERIQFSSKHTFSTTKMNFKHTLKE